MLLRPNLGLALACLLALGTSGYFFGIFLAKAQAVRISRDLDGGYAYGCDFYQIWLTSHDLLFQRADPYSAETITRVQMGVFGRAVDSRRPGDPRPYLARFPYPLYVDFLFAPVALISFRTVQIIGSVVAPFLVVAALLLWRRVLNLSLSSSATVALSVLTLTSYPILQGMYALQLTLVVAVLLAGSANALASGHLVSPGIFLAMASVKPQLMLLPALFLVLWAFSDLRNRKAFLLSFAGTIAFLLLISEAILPGWLRIWVSALFEYRHYDEPPLSQYIFGPVIGNVVAVMLIAVAAILIFRGRRARADSTQFASTFAFLLAITVPLIPSSIAVYDQILLVPAVLWLITRHAEIWNSRRALRALGFIASATISWQWIAACVVGLCCVLFPQIRNTPWMMLPLRTAPSIPFITVALCLFLNWKSQKGDLGRGHAAVHIGS
jgi:hypothetical protein